MIHLSRLVLGALLVTLALGRHVVATDVDGVRELVAAADGERCVLRPPGDLEGLVLLSCALARQGEPEEALQNLEQALKGGFSAFEDLRTTPYLDNLQEDPRFVKLLERYER